MLIARATPRSAHRAMTMKEWALLPGEVRGELVDGHLTEEEMPTRAHERVVTWLLVLFSKWLDARGGGEVTGSEMKYAVSSKRGRKPDVTVFLPGRPPLSGAESVTTVPCDIAVEVITATPRDTRRDRIDKAHEYARFGVRWYWLVDPAVGTLEIFELGTRGRYELAAAASAGRVKVPGCRGLVLDLDALWRKVGPVE